MKLSIVIPLYNEAESIKPLFRELNKLKNKLPKTEIILIDDGSEDETVQRIKSTKLDFPKKLISFSRNFGKDSALVAGLKLSSGDAIVTMDCDLQHPPEVILEMISLHNQGYHIVVTQKIDNVTPKFKNLFSKVYYKVINMFSNISVAEGSSDFRLMSRKSLDALLLLPEKRKFLRGMVHWIGFSQVILPFYVQKRAKGKGKYSFRSLVTLASSSIASFSTLPLYIAGIVGLVMTVLSLIYAVYVVIQYLIGGAVTGWASLQIVTLMTGSFIFIFLGIIGVYLAAIYDEVKNRPDYIIKETYDKKAK